MCLWSFIKKSFFQLSTEGPCKYILNDVTCLGKKNSKQTKQTDILFKLYWLLRTLLKVLFYSRRIFLVAWSKWMPMEQLNTHQWMANQTSSQSRRGVEWEYGFLVWPLTKIFSLTKLVRFLWALSQLGPDLEHIFKSSIFARSLPSQFSPIPYPRYLTQFVIPHDPQADVWSPWPVFSKNSVKLVQPGYPLTPNVSY